MDGSIALVERLNFILTQYGEDHCSCIRIVHNTTRKEGSFRLEENQIKIIDIITKIIKIRKEQIKDKEYITRYKGNSTFKIGSAVTFHNTEKV